ncbi:helix-turn-helix domain-containing protein [Niabella drilacis]|uniref:Helix-turn-helix n=1 Tax=Niabella drilacis (strain DSM 25811 / CCM 8410 / CCUG 62505 / LMG 26954 / E90) TaxID=1285928 RepID=A0A1G6X1H7_NIADE|nr:helix-turn-helix domain-containing protein [Niabella drilacis]SDD71176.1 Helix-turn-helix [Niabella drilacis]
MSKTITKAEFKKAEAEMEKLLAKATAKGGFDALTPKESKLLDGYTETVRVYEEQHYVLPMPDSLQGILQLKMYENQLKQKDLAKVLNTTSTQLSEIMHNKRKPTLAFLKSLNQNLGVDGNLLLKLA